MIYMDVRDVNRTSAASLEDRAADMDLAANQTAC
jgi:hypothetical protein